MTDHTSRFFSPEAITSVLSQRMAEFEYAGNATKWALYSDYGTRVLEVSGPLITEQPAEIMPVKQPQVAEVREINTGKVISLAEQQDMASRARASVEQAWSEAA